MPLQSHKRIHILIISTITLFLTVWLELFLQKKQYLTSRTDNKIILFLLINLHIIIIVILIYLIIRQSIKLVVESGRKLPGSTFKRNLLFAFTIFSVIPSFIVFFIAGKLIVASVDESYLVCQKILQTSESTASLNYKQFRSNRNPVYLSYLFTFILVTLLILFLSIWSAFYLAKGIVSLSESS